MKIVKRANASEDNIVAYAFESCQLFGRGVAYDCPLEGCQPNWDASFDCNVFFSPFS